MRASLLWSLVVAVSAAACVVGSLGATAQEAPRAAPSEDTSKDVEVMRRVIVREALGARRDGRFVFAGAENADFITYATGGGGSEAYLVAGQGATFVLRTSDAVAPGKGDEPAAGAAAPNAWDEEAAAVDGKTVSAATRRRTSRYDAAKVEALRGRVLDALAKYGQKIRGLAPSDRIAVIVVGGSGGGALLEPPSVTNVTDDAKSSLRAATVASAWAHAGGERTVMTMSVAVADCQAAAAGTMNAEEFRRRAVVAAY